MSICQEWSRYLNDYSWPELAEPKADPKSVNQYLKTQTFGRITIFS